MGDAAGTTKRKIRGKRRSYVPRSVIDVPVTESVSVRLFVVVYPTLCVVVVVSISSLFRDRRHFKAIQMLTGKCDLACG
jgi:hypothetical protein